MIRIISKKLVKLANSDCTYAIEYESLEKYIAMLPGKPIPETCSFTSMTLTDAIIGNPKYVDVFSYISDIRITKRSKFLSVLLADDNLWESMRSLYNLKDEPNRSDLWMLINHLIYMGANPNIHQHALVRRIFEEVDISYIAYNITIAYQHGLEITPARLTELFRQYFRPCYKVSDESMTQRYMLLEGLDEMYDTQLLMYDKARERSIENQQAIAKFIANPDVSDPRAPEFCKIIDGELVIQEK